MPIYNSENFFFSPNNTFALRVNEKDFQRTFPQKITFENTELVLKDQFHISVFPITEINEKYGLSLTVDDIQSAFSEFITNNDFKVEFGNEYRYVEDNDRKTIVIMCKETNISDFYDLINKKYSLNIEHPVPHVTLYVVPSGLGIYLLDKEDLDMKSRIMDFNFQ